jgi:hypothetical protein
MKLILSEADRPYLLRIGKRETENCRSQKPRSATVADRNRRTMMKNLILAAFATLSLGMGVANAQSLSQATPSHHNTPTWSNFSGGLAADGGGN